MTFLAPWWLLALVVVPILAAAYVALERRRVHGPDTFARAALRPNLVRASPGLRRHVPIALGLGALALLVMGIARPHLVRSVARDESTIVLAIDTSRSMAATDVAPTRFVAAKEAVGTLLETVPGNVKVGIVSFSASAQPVLPPSLDRDAARAALDALTLGSGTSIGSAILSSVALGTADSSTLAPSEERPPVAVILLSDGAQTTADTPPLDAAARARRLRIRISTVALGTRDAVVEVPLQGGVVEKVRVPPDLQTLRRIAANTGGTFSQALDANKLEEIYRDLGGRLARQRQKDEITSAFGAGGGVLLLLAGGLSTLWFRRAL